MSIYLDLNRTLSYNTLFTFIIGNRGGGKTYGFKQWAINDFIKNKKQFIYLRRYKTELIDVNKFFADIQHEFPDHEFKIRGKEFLIDDEVAGWAVALSTALTKKSVPYPNVNKIGFDEFLIAKSAIHYMANEVMSFLEFYSTVDRLRMGNLSDDVRVIFMGNNISIINPYFQYFKLKPNLNKEFTRKGDILIQYYSNLEYIQKMKETRFGKLIEGTEYANYAIENKSLTEKEEFIEKRSQTAKYIFTIDYKGAQVGVWRDYYNGFIYTSEIIDPSCQFHYCVRTADAQPNISLCKSARKSFHLKQLIIAFEIGSLRYENLRIKSLTQDVLRDIL